MISFAKKFLSIALALILLVGVFPATAFAATGDPHTITVTVTSDVKSETVTVTGYEGDDLAATVDGGISSYLEANGLSKPTVYKNDKGTPISSGKQVLEDRTVFVEVTHDMHEWGPVEVTKKPTCTEVGEGRQTCKYCGAKKVADASDPALQKLPHDFSLLVEKVDATCGNDGHETYKCSVCGQQDTPKVIKATGKHTAGEWRTNPSDPSKKDLHCADCDAVMQTTDKTVYEIPVEFTDVNGKMTVKKLHVVEGEFFHVTDLQALAKEVDPKVDVSKVQFTYKNVQPDVAVNAQGSIDAVLPAATEDGDSTNNGGTETAKEILVPVYKNGVKTSVSIKAVVGKSFDPAAVDAALKDPALAPAAGYKLDGLDYNGMDAKDKGVFVQEGVNLVAKYSAVGGADTSKNGLHKMNFVFNMDGVKDIKGLYIEDNQRIASKFTSGKLPTASTDKQLVIGWADPNGKRIDNESIFDYAETEVTFHAIWRDAARVTVKYFVNNKFDKPAYEIQLPFVAVGEDYDISPEYLLKQYKNGYHSAKRLDGPYGLDGFRRYEENYRHGQRPNGTIEVITGVGGPGDRTSETVLYCMVFDSGYNPNSKPDSTNPKTGDSSMIYATTAVMLISAGALAVFFMDRKRRNG